MIDETPLQKDRAVTVFERSVEGRRAFIQTMNREER